MYEYMYEYYVHKYANTNIYINIEPTKGVKHTGFHWTSLDPRLHPSCVTACLRHDFLCSVYVLGWI